MKVLLDPPKEVRVRCMFETDIVSLTKIVAIRQVWLYWNNGILFDFAEYPTTEKETRESSDIFHVDSLTYAVCPEFIPESKYNGISVDVINCNGHTFFDEFIKGLKELKK